MLNVLTALDTAASFLICRRGVDPSVYVIRDPSHIWIMGYNLGLNMNILPTLLCGMCTNVAPRT